jgi:hypothetical protein
LIFLSRRSTIVFVTWLSLIFQHSTAVCLVIAFSVFNSSTVLSVFILFLLFLHMITLFLVCNHSQENPKTKTWRPCWYHKQKKLMRNLLLSSSNIAMTSHANEELSFYQTYFISQPQVLRPVLQQDSSLLLCSRLNGI